MHVGLNVSLGDNSVRRERIFLFLKENESFFFKNLNLEVVLFPVKLVLKVIIETVQSHYGTI